MKALLCSATITYNMHWLQCAFLQGLRFSHTQWTDKDHVKVERHFLKTTVEYEILGHDVCRGSQQTWHKVSGTGAKRSCLFLDKFGYQRREKVWKSDADEAEPRFFRAALRLSLIWTFPRCLSQLAVVLYYVVCRFRMSSESEE